MDLLLHLTNSFRTKSRSLINPSAYFFACSIDLFVCSLSFSKVEIMFLKLKIKQRHSISNQLFNAL